MSNFKEIVNNLNINIKFKPSEIKKFKKEIIFPLMILDFEAYRFLSTSPYYIKDDKCIHKPFLAGVLVIKNISFFSDKNKDNFKYEHFTSLRRSDDQYKPILKIFKRLNDKIERNKVKTIMCLDINMEKNIINFAKTKKFTSKTWNNIKYIDIFKIINNSSVFSFNDQEGNLINKNKAENIAKISEGFDKNLKKRM
ncbi:hypothetical protein NPX79_03420 [Spiroplasma endosymbiont of Anurida maritima]|uniref:hypothetical protein n=1 Tax=Spiroplasma endosymbiont of Anurida maritima TaxID=2967972 RepID=UPI0036D42EBD